jgi:hypothetical protein
MEQFIQRMNIDSSRAPSHHTYTVQTLPPSKQPPPITIVKHTPLELPIRTSLTLSCPDTMEDYYQHAYAHDNAPTTSNPTL